MQISICKTKSKHSANNAIRMPLSNEMLFKHNLHLFEMIVI